ncbi:PAS fold-containing protein [[Clostridium] polysaccharolyticum]|uniref:PAS fold-containing protein n=2 Tax=[Clostridium] polysaccharolyticum TaxID=29364 RepID=A0A1I0FH97_9FIRM|nr:PAS fold-containing protein [[Clostridium] polysaccharolyticum]
MKLGIQKIFQELASYVDFPTIVFINETGKIIGKNRSASEIIGEKCKYLKEVMSTEVEARFRHAIIEQEKQVFYNVKVLEKEQSIEIDMQVNVILYEKQHVTICFFEQSYKMMYDKYMSLLVPRLFYKTSQCDFIMANRHFMADNNLETANGVRNEDFLEEEVCKFVSLSEENVIRSKQAEFNVVHTIKLKWKQEKDYFIRLNLVPVLDRNGEAVGLLGNYNIILSRDEYKGLFDTVLRQKQMLSRIVSQQGKYTVACRMEEGWPIEYVSSNFAEFGYPIHEVYSGIMKWARLVHPADLERVKKELDLYMKEPAGKLPFLVYRIRKGNGRYVWIEDITYSIISERNTYLREGMFYVFPEECYKELEKKYERGAENEGNS